MHLYLTGRNLELSTATREHVQRRLVRPIEAHSQAHEVQRIEIQLYRNSDKAARYGCHVMLQVPNQRDLNVREEAHDLYEAIDLAEKRVLRRLIELRERRTTLKRHPRQLSWERLGRAFGWVRGKQAG